MYAADNDPITSLRTLEVDNLVFDMVDRCNLVCPSCYHGIHGGTKTKMSLDTCRTILDHCRDYFRPKSIWPFNWGEPLICENLGEFISLFARYPEMTLRLSSNMNADISDELIEHVVRNTSQMIFSLSGIDQATYRQYHKGGNVEVALRNIERFVAARDRLNSPISLVWSFGLSRNNAHNEPAIRRYCEERGIGLGVTRYYVTDAQDAFKILHGIPVKPQIYAQFYASAEDVLTDIQANLTPNRCSMLRSDIVVDTDGYLMLCCATKVTTKIHITEVTSINQIVRERLNERFCKSCYKDGIAGYFQR